MRVISWNLLRLTGAAVKDVAALIEGYHPDLLLMQEATEEVAALPTIVGGHCFREHLHGRIYGLAAWSRHPLTPPYALPLPVSAMPGKVPPRVAQIVCFGVVTFANVHLSHGQVLNRWQLSRIARTLEGPAAIVGDYNAVGPTRLSGFKDVGPLYGCSSPSPWSVGPSSDHPQSERHVGHDVGLRAAPSLPRPTERLIHLQERQLLARTFRLFRRTSCGRFDSELPIGPVLSS